MRKKREGFKGQKLIVLNKKIRQQIMDDELCRQLFFTDIGYFPKADNHFVMRDNGCTEYVIIFCFNGKGWCEYKGIKRPIQPGEFFILPPNEKHSYGSQDNSFWQKGWIHFSGTASDLFAQKINKNDYGQPIPFKMPKSWIAHFNKMIENLSLDLSFDNVSYNCFQLWGSLGELIHRDSQRGNSEADDHISKVLKYMYENIKEIITLEELADVAELSVSRFCVLFKESMGQPPMDYLSELKIQQTCRLLSMTDWPVKDIAHQFGFEDQYYFSRRFKQKMGVSPKKFREENFYS